MTSKTYQKLRAEIGPRLQGYIRQHIDPMFGIPESDKLTHFILSIPLVMRLEEVVPAKRPIITAGEIEEYQKDGVIY